MIYDVAARKGFSHFSSNLCSIQNNCAVQLRGVSIFPFFSFFYMKYSWKPFASQNAEFVPFNDLNGIYELHIIQRVTKRRGRDRSKVLKDEVVSGIRPEKGFRN